VPAPPDAAPQVQSVQVDRILAVPLIEKTFQLENKIYRRAKQLIDSL
jgi:hypothetical protein